MYWRNYVFWKVWLDKCLRRPVSEDSATSNMLNDPKYCWNLYESNFIKFTDQCKRNWAGNSLSKLYEKSYDCLLTHWLPMKSILFLIVTI